MGVIILDRTKHPIVQTEVRKKTIELSRRVIAESRRVYEIVKEAQNTVSAEIAIGIIPSLDPYLLLRSIGDFTQKYPDV